MRDYQSNNWLALLGEYVTYLAAGYVIFNHFFVPISNIKLGEIAILVFALYFMFSPLFKETGKDIEDSIEKTGETLTEMISDKISEIENKIDEINEHDEFDG